MNSWICPVKPNSWRLVKNRMVFGSARKALMQELRIGDILYFYVFRPVNGIIGKAKIISELFEDNEDIWGKDLYRYRVKIEILNDYLAERKQPFKLSYFFNNVIDKNITVEPYLRNVTMVKISDEQSNTISEHFNAQTQ